MPRAIKPASTPQVRNQPIAERRRIRSLIGVDRRTGERSSRYVPNRTVVVRYGQEGPPLMKPAPLEYLAASTAEEALAALERFAGNARLLAGGQSLVPLLSMRLLRPTAVIESTGSPGLDRIVAGDGVVARRRAGAVLATWRRRPRSASGSRCSRKPSPSSATGRSAIAARSAARCATPIRPASWPSASVTLGARLRIVGPAGRRELDARGFFQGPYTTALEPTEMLEAVDFPRRRGHRGGRRGARAASRRLRRGQLAATGLREPDGSGAGSASGSAPSRTALATRAAPPRGSRAAAARRRRRRRRPRAAWRTPSRPRTSAPPPSTGATSYRCSWSAPSRELARR